MVKWDSDPELFLHSPHYPASTTVYTKRCLDMTNTVPLTGNDLIGAFPYRPSEYYLVVNSPWSQSDFQRLIDYISPRHYLVNCQGLVLLEVFPFDENENIAASVPIYVRLFDVIDLTNFGISPRPKKVPARTIKYIVDGTDAKVDNPVIAPVPTIPPVPTQPGSGSTSKGNKSGRPDFDPSWMTNNWKSNWVDVYELVRLNKKMDYTTGTRTPLDINRTATNFGDDKTTNVGRNSFYGVRWLGASDASFFPIKVADVASLGSKGYAKARFDPNVWGVLDNRGTLYAARMTDRLRW